MKSPRWTSDEYANWLYRCGQIPSGKNDKKDSPSLPPSDMEPRPGHEPVAKEGVEGFDGPVSVLIHSKRIKETDADGASSKYLLDALVDCKVLPDDSPKYVKEVIHTQEKIKKWEPEETIVEFWG